MCETHRVDARGLKCPLPVLKARKRLKALAKGDVLVVEADDPAAIIDIPHFCAEQGHEFLGQDPGDGDAVCYKIKK